MSVTRRELFSRLRFAGTAAAGDVEGLGLSARGLEDETFGQAGRPQTPGIKLSSNENPVGPGRAVLDAITGRFGHVQRYPFNVAPVMRS
jgi:histidinol-phosphate/aromatic aminotransferase/cobyric acid decarboxylase-like protein